MEKQKEKRITDFNGVVVKDSSCNKGITFTANEDIDVEHTGWDGSPYVHCITETIGNTLYFKRNAIRDLEIVNVPVSLELIEYVKEKLKDYLTYKYIDSIKYLEALYNINKIKVIKK
jgi:hypothetical protein